MIPAFPPISIAILDMVIRSGIERERIGTGECPSGGGKPWSCNRSAFAGGRCGRSPERGVDQAGRGRGRAGTAGAGEHTQSAGGVPDRRISRRVRDLSGVDCAHRAHGGGLVSRNARAQQVRNGNSGDDQDDRDNDQQLY